MFLFSEQIKKEAQRIINDDIDNDILLIVAHKGIGKTKLLNEIFGSTAYNRNLIVATGNAIRLNVASIKKCFAEGIIEYASRNNQKRDIRKKIIKNISISKGEAIKSFWVRKIPKGLFANELCKLTLCELKSLYFEVANDTPLVVMPSSMTLSSEEVEYLETLDNDPYGLVGARITFILGVRAVPNCISSISRIINGRQKGVWLLPLMPDIEVGANKKDIHSMASFSIRDDSKGLSSKTVDLELLTEFLNNDSYGVVRDFLDKGLNPQKIHILANQEISKKSYDYLQDITKGIYKISSSQFGDGLILPYDNKLLWLDVLSYYFALQKDFDTVILETQKFYFLLINRILYKSNGKDVIFGKPERNSFLSFIHEAMGVEGNSIADGYAQYYSDFAKLTEILFSRTVYNTGNSTNDLMKIGVLERVAIDFSVANMQALKGIYGSTQICLVLDIGLKALTEYLGEIPTNKSISSEITDSIIGFVELCITELYKWNDLTLLEKVMDFLTVSSKKGCFNISYSKIVVYEMNAPMAELVRSRINERIARREIVMDSVNQNLINFWNKKGKSIVEEYKIELPFPIGKALKSSLLDEKMIQCEFIIITANSVENSIITRKMMESCGIERPERITEDDQIYQFFNFMGHQIVHLIPQRTSSFSEHGSSETISNALKRIASNSRNKLKAVFSLGVAYGLYPSPDENHRLQDIGDVMIAERIIRWDAFIKLTNGKIFLNDRDIRYIGSEILAGCKQFFQIAERPSSKEVGLGEFNWFCGTMFSGNAVLNDKEFKNELMQAAEEKGVDTKKIVGGEMEGSGIWFALRNYDVPFLIIKGICDWGENKNGWDYIIGDKEVNDLVKDCIQAYACDNAYKTFEFIVSQVYGEQDELI